MLSTPRPSGRPRFDLSPLAHPAWWACLALLLVNDNLLKGGGLVPGWLTGKLSDFAFIVVAPTLFAAMLPLALPWRRALAVAAVVGLFVATNLSPAASDAFVAVAARLGLAARLWPDPTDLLALAALPLTLHLLRLPQRRERALVGRVGVLFGAVACVATTAPITYPHRAFLFNAAASAQTVRLTWVLKRVACVQGEVAVPTLGPSDLDDPVTISLERGQVAALAGPTKKAEATVGNCGESAISDSTCVAAILEADGADDVLFIAPRNWPEQSGTSTCRSTLDPVSDPGPDAVSLRVVNGRLSFVAGGSPLVRLVPIDAAAVAAGAPDPDGCRTLRETYQALSVPGTCATNSDCLGRAGLNIAGAEGCEIDINPVTNAAIVAIESRWSPSCVPGEYRSCPIPRPAVCVAGHCAPACPGVTIPDCPGACGDPVPISGTSCTYPWQCRRADGQDCSCNAVSVTCAPPPALGTCPVSCLTYPGGGHVADAP